MKQELILYKQVVTSNMLPDEKGKDDRIKQFTNFLIEHEFKDIRVTKERSNRKAIFHKNRLQKTENLFNLCVDKWDTMPELMRLSILKRKFGIREVVQQWLLVLPNFAKKLKSISE